MTQVTYFQVYTNSFWTINREAFAISKLDEALPDVLHPIHCLSLATQQGLATLSLLLLTAFSAVKGPATFFSQTD